MDKTTTMQQRRALFPALEPYRRGRLQVSARHELYFEECGNPHGHVVVVLHGGPGGGSSPLLRQLNDPQVYRIVLFDQRGSGRSTPYAALEENTTWDLVADMELLRQHLGVERWHIVGGSWGSTLALTYAVTHPARVLSLVLRGIFTVRRSEIDWFYQSGASALFPEAFARFVTPIPIDERDHLVAAYYKRLICDDGETRRTCAKAWSQWEGATLSLLPNLARVAAFGEDHFAEAFARIEAHYFVNGGFFASDGWLLNQADKLSDIPGSIINGRYDVVTPPHTALALHKQWPRAELVIVEDAGHAVAEPGISDAMVRATDRIATLFAP